MKKPPKIKKKRRPLRTPPATGAKKSLWLNVLPDDIWIRVKYGITIYEALRKTTLDLDTECNGLGTCGKCKIKVITPIGPPDRQEQRLLTSAELDQGIRLACRTPIRKDLVVFSDTQRDPSELFQILKHGQTQDIALDPLLDRIPVLIPPPDLQTAASDFHRLRNVLGASRDNLKITHGCLSTLYADLRATEFRGEALLHRECMLAWSPVGSPNGRYGVIFDIGTTTLVGKLIDLDQGVEKGVISRLNAQTRFGSNIISRIQYLRDTKNGLPRLRSLLLNDLNAILRRLARAGDIETHHIFVAVAAGNTTMQHLLLGLDPSGIAEAPFAPVITEGVTFPTQKVGLDLHPDAMLYVMPAKSGYIGGDLISFILASGAADQETELVLGLDLGTNGEIFLGNGRRLLTCSAAAGPALEGARIQHGMIAKSGAIESVRGLEGELRYNVIGNTKPKGLCGSGLVDLAAVLLHHGVLDPEGLLGHHGRATETELLHSRLAPRPGSEVLDFVVATPEESFDGRTIKLLQNDIRELQLAKGAVAAAVQLLMDDMGVTVDRIDRVCMAGALGNYVNPLSAMRIGMLPFLDPAKIVSMGNAAATGATLALIAKAQWQRANAIADLADHVELSLHPGFYEAFIAAMDFPDRNVW